MAIADSASRSNAEPGLAGVAGAPVQPSPEHRNALDGLRVIAAAAVLAANVGGATGFAFTGSPGSWVATRGDVGVPIFFALSGFLLYRPWAVAALHGQGGPSIRGYLRRRVLRIVPAYWVVVAIAMITFNVAHARSALTWIQYLFFAQNYDPHPWWIGTGAPGLGQMWSLAVDASFYLALPLLAALLAAAASLGSPGSPTRARRLLAGVAVLGASSYGFLVLAYRPGSALLWLSVTLPAMLTWFAAGMALAVLTAWADAEPGQDGPASTLCAAVAAAAAPCLLVAGLLFVIACTPVAGPEAFGIPSLWQAEIKTGLYTMIAILLVAPAACQWRQSTRLSEALGGPLMRGLASISYGVFLWQAVAILALFNLMHLRRAFTGGYYLTLSTVGLYLVIAASTCLVATLSYYLIERPALRWSDPAPHQDQPPRQDQPTPADQPPHHDQPERPGPPGAWPASGSAAS